MHTPKISGYESQFFAPEHQGGLRFRIGLFIALTCLAFGVARAQTTNYALGTTALVVGPTSGTNSVVLAVSPATGAWTATTNATWLHLSAANQTGLGSTNVIFSYDANPATTRSGTLTIAGQTLTVTQAGATYVAAQPVTSLVPLGLNAPYGVAVDGAGNVYVADSGNNAVLKWTEALDTVSLVAYSASNYPQAVAVDHSGNVYFADSGNSTIQKWSPATSNVTTLVSSGLSFPGGVAVDAAGNVYIADTYNSAIKEWSVANSNVTTLVSSGLSFPYGVAVDRAGNVYIADTGNNAIKEWTVANSNVTTLVSTVLNQPQGVAVDGSGNVYIPDTYNSAVRKWSAATGILSVAGPGGYPYGVAVDGAGNIYIAQTDKNAIEEVTYAFVDPTARLEGAVAGNDSLPVALPSTENLLPPFVPASNEPWLTITGVTNGMVSFSFSGNPTTTVRAAQISLLGQTITVTQLGLFKALLGMTERLEGPAAGSDSVVLAATPASAPWAATANASWLHLSSAYQSGTGSTNVIFSFDANSGATRSGTLTIAGLTFTVSQAGSTYIAAGSVTALVSSGLDQPQALTVDGAGNVYFADSYNGAVKKWTLTNNLASLVASGIGVTYGVALDAASNIYVSESANDCVQEWTPAYSFVTTYGGLNGPTGVAVDSAGNLDVAISAYGWIRQWNPDRSAVTTLVEGLSVPNAVAADAAGNLYIADAGANSIAEFTANSNLTTLLVLGPPSSGSGGPGYSYPGPYGVAVDGAGNVYYASNSIYELTAASGSTTNLVSSGLSGPWGVAVDGAGNIYIADTGNNAIKELPRAFVDPTAKAEGGVAGTDALPPVLPTTENLLPPFAPTSDQPWLTISGISNGVVSFSFAANPGASRTAHITLLGQTIPITQGIGTVPDLGNARMISNGVFQFGFSSTLNTTFTILSATNLLTPLSNWTAVGTATNNASNVFQFTSQPTTNDAQRYYRVVAP